MNYELRIKNYGRRPCLRRSEGKASRYRNSLIHYSLFIILAATLLIAAVPAQAQGGLIPTPTGSCPQGEGCYAGKCVGGDAPPSAEAVAAATYPCNYTLEDIVRSGINFANLVFGITGSLMLLMFVYGGQQMILSMGNQEEIQKGKRTLTAAFVGAIIILGATIFIRFGGMLIGAQFGGGADLGQTVIPSGPSTNEQRPPIMSGCTCTASISVPAPVGGEALCNNAASQYHLNCRWSRGACNCAGPVPGVTREQCSIAGIREVYNIPAIPGVTVNGSCSWQ